MLSKLKKSVTEFKNCLKDIKISCWIFEKIDVQSDHYNTDHMMKLRNVFAVQYTII